MQISVPVTFDATNQTMSVSDSGLITFPQNTSDFSIVTVNGTACITPTTVALSNGYVQPEHYIQFTVSDTVEEVELDLYADISGAPYLTNLWIEFYSDGRAHQYSLVYDSGNAKWLNPDNTYANLPTQQWYSIKIVNNDSIKIYDKSTGTLVHSRFFTGELSYINLGKFYANTNFYLANLTLKRTINTEAIRYADSTGIAKIWANIKNWVLAHIGNGTLTIQKNGTNVTTFSANSSSNATANITVPTKVSDLTNDSGFLTTANIPSKTSDLTNDSGFLTSHQSLSNYVTLNGVQTISNTKVFTKKQSIKNTAITNYKAAPSNDTVISVEFLSNDGKFWGALSHSYYTTGHSVMALETSNWTTSGTQGHWRIQFGTDKALSPVYFRPEANNTVDLGDSSHQWKSVYAQSYYYNGTAWGLNAENNWTHFNRFNAYRLQIKNSSQQIGVIPTSSQWNGIQFVDKNNNATVNIEHGFLPTETRLHFKIVDNLESSSTGSTVNVEMMRLATYTGGRVVAMGADTRPLSDNTYNLGASDRRWKTLNGVNPGALSFPNLEYSDSNKWIDIKPAITNTAGADNWYYPAVDGWVFIIASGGAAPDLNVLVFIASGLNFISGAVPAAESSTGARWCHCLAPAGSRVRIRFNKGSTSCIIEKAFFIPCQGNV